MLLNISAKNCSYRGEGNANIIISLKKEEKVLRLFKADATSEKLTLEDQLKLYESQISFIRNVIKPLLGENLVNCHTVVFLSKDDIKMLNNLVSSYRPNFRIHKNAREENSYAVMLPDYCTLPPDLGTFPSYGPVLSIEIKPKQGFVADEHYLPSTSSSKSLLKCQFCMMQYYKLKNNSIISKSGYCPTDLFSGCPYRMHHALKMLLQSPQNNLRIFKEQEVIYSDEKRNNLEEVLSDFFQNKGISCSDSLCDVVTQVLLKAFPFKVNEIISPLKERPLMNCANACHSCLKDGIYHELPLGCILYRILSVQMLDRLSIQSIYSMYLQVKESSGDELTGCIGCYSRSEIPPYLGKMEKMEDETDYQYASRKVWEWIVALVLRDCSIMLVLKNYSGSCDISQCQNLITDSQGNSYLFSIAITDLDEKSLSTILKHYKRMPLILQSCLSQSV